MKETKIKLLFVCTINRMRSATAQVIFDSDERFEVSSAGTSAYAKTVLDEPMLTWADVIIVMERSHRNFINKKYPKLYASKKIICLYIEDEYDFMQPELVVLLQLRMEDIIKKGLLS